MTHINIIHTEYIKPKVFIKTCSSEGIGQLSKNTLSYFAACGTVITDCVTCNVVDGFTTCTDCGAKVLSTDGTACVSKCLIKLINMAKLKIHNTLS